MRANIEQRLQRTREGCARGGCLRQLHARATLMKHRRGGRRLAPTRFVIERQVRGCHVDGSASGVNNLQARTSECHSRMLMTMRM
jgi:hypothetical protein